MLLNLVLYQHCYHPLRLSKMEWYVWTSNGIVIPLDAEEAVTHRSSIIGLLLAHVNDSNAVAAMGAAACWLLVRCVGVWVPVFRFPVLPKRPTELS